MSGKEQPTPEAKLKLIRNERRLVNMGYGLNAMVHNTSWVTAHFHLIFGGTVIIMYFPIAYEIWPRLAGREAPSIRAQRIQLWMWFAHMMLMSLPWHWLGLQGPVHPLTRVPRALNGFGLWNALVLVLTIAAYGWPIAHAFIIKAPQAVVHRVDRAG